MGLPCGSQSDVPFLQAFAAQTGLGAPPGGRGEGVEAHPDPESCPTESQGKYPENGQSTRKTQDC